MYSKVRYNPRADNNLPLREGRMARHYSIKNIFAIGGEYPLVHHFHG